MRVRPVNATLALGLGTLVSHGFGLSLVPAMLPRIEDEFQSGYGVLGLAVASGLLAYAVGSAFASSIMRSVPTRGLLLGTFAVTGTGFVVSALASSPVYVALAVMLLGISAPVSWTATIHIAGQTVADDSLSMVTAGASGGAAFGIVVNGILVNTSGGLHSWRVSFLIAALVALAAIVAVRTVFQPVDRPERMDGSPVRSFGRVLRDRSGLMIVVTSTVSGVGVFTLATYLTATAIDEMGVSDTATAALLWVAGMVGVASAVVLGRLGDRKTPTLAMALAMTTYATALVFLSLVWTYAALVVAVVGYGVLNGPVWGLMGSVAARRFPSELSVSAVSLGLVAASAIGAIVNSATGVWLDATGSLRWPIVLVATLTSSTAIYLSREARRGTTVTGVTTRST